MTDWFAILNSLCKIGDIGKDASKKDATIPAALPATKPIQIVDPEQLKLDVQNMGLAVEKKISTEAVTPADGTRVVTTTPIIDFTKTATPTTPKTENKTTETKAENKNEEKKTSTKSKRTIDEAMRASYPNWDKLSKEEKEKKIVDHLTSINKEEFNYLATKNQPDGRIGWLKSFLLNERMTEEESKTVVGALKDLNVSKEEFAELQAQGVKMAFDDDNQNKESCQMQVAEDMTKYGLKAQKVAVEKTSTSKFDNVKIKGAEQTSGLDKTIQADAVKQYVEGSKTSTTEIQKQIGKSIVDQYGQYAKEAELEIHNTISFCTSKEIQAEMQKYSADNIWKFDSENQAKAFKITMKTENEEAINIATQNWDKYAECARPEISQMVYESDYDCAKETLTNFGVTEDTYPKQTSTTKESSEASSISYTQEMKQLETKLNEALKSGDMDSIKEIMKKNPNKGMMLLDTLNTNDLFAVLMALLQSNPSMNIMFKVMGFLDKFDGRDRKALLTLMNKNTASRNYITSNFSMFGLAQKNILEELAQSGNLKDISKRDLNSNIHTTYMELLKKRQG